MKKSKIIILGVLLIIFIVLGVFLLIKNNKFYSLNKIIDIDLNDVYIRGRDPYYDASLNYKYGNYIYAQSLSNGDTANEVEVFYDKNNVELFKLVFLGNRNQVEINSVKYIYDESYTTEYKCKEIYPNKDNNCDKIVNDIIQLFDEDDSYMWDYRKDETFGVNLYCTNETYFTNAGISLDVIEFNSKSKVDQACNAIISNIKSWYGATIQSQNDNSIRLSGANTDLQFVLIRDNNFLFILHEYTYDIYQTGEDLELNIKIVEDYLKQKGILSI